MKTIKLNDNQITLINGDSSEILKKIKSECIDLTVTSPPYDNLRDYNGYSFDFEIIAKELFRVTKHGGCVAWVVGDQTKDFCESLTSFKQAIYFVEQCGFNLLDTMIYNKSSYPPTYPNILRYAPIFEYIFILSKGKPKTFNPIKDKLNKSNGRKTSSTQRKANGTLNSAGNHTVNEFGLRSNVWTYDVGKFQSASEEYVYNHPAIFPEQLAQDCILSWSNENDVVLDPFMGSGTTAKMSILNNRRFIGVELSEEYFDNIAVKRCEDAIK